MRHKNGQVIGDFWILLKRIDFNRVLIFYCSYQTSRSYRSLFPPLNFYLPSFLNNILSFIQRNVASNRFGRYYKQCNLNTTQKYTQKHYTMDLCNEANLIEQELLRQFSIKTNKPKQVSSVAFTSTQLIFIFNYDTKDLPFPT